MIGDQCFKCLNRLRSIHCRAFLDERIPQEILNGSFDHTKPYKGDNGIRFEEETDDTPFPPIFGLEDEIEKNAKSS